MCRRPRSLSVLASAMTVPALLRMYTSGRNPPIRGGTSSPGTRWMSTVVDPFGYMESSTFTTSSTRRRCSSLSDILKKIPESLREILQGTELIRRVGSLPILQDPYLRIRQVVDLPGQGFHQLMQRRRRQQRPAGHRAAPGVGLLVEPPDGLFYGSRSAAKKDLLRLFIRKDFRELSHVGESIDFAVANPLAEILQFQAGFENGILDARFWSSTNPLNLSILKALSSTTSR